MALFNSMIVHWTLIPHISQSVYLHEITQKSFYNTNTPIKVGDHFLIQLYYSNIEQEFFYAMASNKELLPERRLTHFLKQGKNILYQTS